MRNYFTINKTNFGIIIILLFSYCKDAPEQAINTKASASTQQINKNNNTIVHTCYRISYNPKNEFNINTAYLTGNYLLLKPFKDTSYWEIYHEFIQESWKKLETQRLNKIKNWREKEISVSDNLSRTIFYPFSGPDFLTVSMLFPKADTFIMLGLEPVGALPDFSKLKAKDQEEYLSHFSGSLSDIFNKSYFITKNMLNDFQTNKVNGLMPVLCFFVQKLNYDIADIKYIYKDSTQKIKEADYHYKNKQKTFGIKITAIKDSCAKTIYYFRYNVMDKFFNDSTVFYHYIAQYHNYITYIKSASYLLHNPFMNNMRKLILNNSVAILQDDTGIPYTYLKDTNEWTLKLYGQYDKPVKDFGKMGYQPDLAKKMKQDSAKIPALPFHLGYHWGSKKDVLFFTIKKNKIKNS